MPRRLPEYDQILALGAEVNPETGFPYQPSEIAGILGINPNSTGYILRRNGGVYNPRPSLPYIEALTPGEKAFFLGLATAGIIGKDRRWFNTPLHHLVIKERRNRDREDGNTHPLKKALDERRRMVMLGVLPRYADVRDDDVKTTAYMDPKAFGFMLEGERVLNGQFFMAERRVSPFTFALLTARFSYDMYAVLPDLDLARRVKKSYKRLYGVGLTVHRRKNRAGELRAIVQVPQNDRQKLLEGVLGSKSVRSLPFFGKVMGLDKQESASEPVNGDSQLGIEAILNFHGLAAGGFSVDYDELNNAAKNAGARLLNDSNW